jgi:hypothetical protein
MIDDRKMKILTVFISIIVFMILAQAQRAMALSEPHLLSASGMISEDLMLLQLRWTSPEMSNIKEFRVYLKEKTKNNFDMICDISINNNDLMKNGDTLTVSIGTPLASHAFGWYNIYVGSVDNYNIEKTSNILEFEIKDSQRDMIYFTSDLPEKCYMGESLSTIISAGSNTQNNILFKVNDAPNGFTIEKYSGRINWVPDSNGYFEITLEAFLENKPDVYVRNTWLVNVLKCKTGGSLEITIKDMNGNSIEDGACELYEYQLDSLFLVTQGKIGLNGKCELKDLDEREYLLYLNGTNIVDKIFVSEWYSNSKYAEHSEPIKVYCGNRTSIEANVIRYPKFDEYEVTGNVTDEDGAPVQNAFVRFYGSSVMSNESSISNALVDSLGNYSITLSNEFTYFAYCFSYKNEVLYEDDIQYISEYYDNVPNIMEARTIFLDDDLDGINFRLEKADLTNNSVYGYVIDSYDNPISFANVSAFCLDEDSKYQCQSVSTGKDGYFSFIHLKPGQYILFAVPINNNSIPNYLNSESRSEFYWGNAQIISISENNEYGPYEIITEGTGINLGNAEIEGFVFADQGEIKGSDDLPMSGKPINGANVYLVEENMNTIKYTNTNEDGSFSFANISNGSYTLIVDKVGYALYIREFGNIYDGDFIMENVLLSNDLLSSVTNNYELNSSEILVTPIPASDFIHVSTISGERIKNIKLLDINGITQMIPIHFIRDDVQIDVSNLSNGVYFLIVELDEKHIQISVCIYK